MDNVCYNISTAKGRSQNKGGREGGKNDAEPCSRGSPATRHPGHPDIVLEDPELILSLRFSDGTTRHQQRG